jgi:hypothetical protein
VIGAGEMGEETVRYLIDEGAARSPWCNRHWSGLRIWPNGSGRLLGPWDDLHEAPWRRPIW